jgi:hypothetical protein
MMIYGDSSLIRLNEEERNWSVYVCIYVCVSLFLVYCSLTRPSGHKQIFHRITVQN